MAREVTREWLESKVEMVPEMGCWIWMGSLGGNKGYGRARLHGRHGRKTRAHRISFELYKGQIPDGLLVLHRCDVPACVNPAHLFVGTQKVNMHDAKVKGRLKFMPRKITCIRGHNDWKTRARGDRYCVTCKREQRRDG
jgi:HNH endonuclease